MSRPPTVLVEGQGTSKGGGILRTTDRSAVKKTTIGLTVNDIMDQLNRDDPKEAHKKDRDESVIEPPVDMVLLPPVADDALDDDGESADSGDEQNVPKAS